MHNRAVSVRGGRLHVDGGYLPGAEGRDGWVVTHNGNRGWRNYRIDVQADASNLGGSPRVNMVTLYARVDDTTSGTGRATCYRLDLWAPGLDPRGSGTIPDGLVMLVRSVAGVTEEALFVEASNLRPLVNTVSWRLVHGRHRVVVNDRKVLDWVEPAPLRYGGVGLGRIWETNPAFDTLSRTGLIPGS